VNNLRSNRSATPGSLSPLTSLTESDLLAERGRELYWQDHRRTDLIRFGKFLDARLLKPVSDPKCLLFPLPRAAVLANTNLKQNPGY
jgi:starch-binding outer membrane protein, SusD/RagB family